jgi:tetratricopeptide (TPR) repeat protein
MAVTFGAFLAGGLVQRRLSARGIGLCHSPDARGLKTVLVVAVTSLAASLVNPLYHEQYLFGRGIMGSAWWKQLVVELQPPAGDMFAVVCVVDALVLLSFALNWRRFSAAHFLLVAPFLVLPFTAVRFMSLPVIVGAPVVARNLSGFLEATNWDGTARERTLRVVSGMVVAALVALVLLRVEPVGRKDWRFGLGAHYADMPVGAVRYLDERNITGRVLNTFHFGQYIIWTGYPRRTVFIDARGAVDDEVLEQSIRFLTSDEVLETMHARYGFESILINYIMPLGEETQPLTGRKEAFSHPDWALVYWDDDAMVYLRRGGPYRDVVQADEYLFVQPNVPLDAVMRHAVQPDRREGMLRELERNATVTGSARSRFLLAYVRLANGRFREALDALADAEEKAPAELGFAIDFGRGEAYRGMLDADRSIAAYEDALEIVEDPYVLYRLGEAYALRGDRGRAVGYLSRAVKRADAQGEAHVLLARLLRAEGRGDEAREVEERLSSLTARLPGREAFERGMRAYREKRYDDAIEAFQDALEKSPEHHPLIHANLGYAYLDSGRPESAARHFSRALELDAGHANAHYGLGILALRKGDPVSAQGHFRAYLRAEPAGYYARRARAILDKLEAN